MPDSRQPHPGAPPREALEGGPGPRAGFPDARTSKLPPNNLPLELTSFIGREREMTEVKGLLSETRLMTLTGPGGCGKTRLALKVATDVAEEFDGGVWWVELASLSDPDLVPQLITSVLDLREAPGRSLTEALTEHLESKKALLVLDNCEHLISACAVLADVLLHACPDLRIVTTSREALGIVGETVWPVPSLSLPDPGRPPALRDLARCEAIRLFVERAAPIFPAFALTEGNAPAVAQVCRRLDGIPLAIELAAVRVRALSAEQIAERLDDRFRLLTGGSRTALSRQQTLQATMGSGREVINQGSVSILQFRDQHAVFGTV